MKKKQQVAWVALTIMGIIYVMIGDYTLAQLMFVGAIVISTRSDY